MTTNFWCLVPGAWCLVVQVAQGLAKQPQTSKSDSYLQLQKAPLDKSGGAFCIFEN
jgi:hypothetical protein